MIPSLYCLEFISLYLNNQLSSCVRVIMIPSLYCSELISLYLNNQLSSCALLWYIHYIANVSSFPYLNNKLSTCVFIMIPSLYCLNQITIETLNYILCLSLPLTFVRVISRWNPMVSILNVVGEEWKAIQALLSLRATEWGYVLPRRRKTCDTNCPIPMSRNSYVCLYRQELISKSKNRINISPLDVAEVIIQIQSRLTGYGSGYPGDVTFIVLFHDIVNCVVSWHISIKNIQGKFWGIYGCEVHRMGNHGNVSIF